MCHSQVLQLNISQFTGCISSMARLSIVKLTAALYSDILHSFWNISTIAGHNLICQKHGRTVSGSGVVVRIVTVTCGVDVRIDVNIVIARLSVIVAVANQTRDKVVVHQIGQHVLACYVPHIERSQCVQTSSNIGCVGIREGGCHLGFFAKPKHSTKLVPHTRFPSNYVSKTRYKVHVYISHINCGNIQ
ncbi:hypothetical protein LSAT2_011142 [Lamellibrachia satsuma]|nr:hypothetical protein LSAT2_011142 [Lamellibrachia satsuma]